MVENELRNIQVFKCQTLAVSNELGKLSSTISLINICLQSFVRRWCLDEVIKSCPERDCCCVTPSEPDNIISVVYDAVSRKAKELF
jgi:hypothetical protein